MTDSDTPKVPEAERKMQVETRQDPVDVVMSSPDSPKIHSTPRKGKAAKTLSKKGMSAPDQRAPE